MRDVSVMKDAIRIKKCFYDAIKSYFESLDYTRKLSLGVKEFECYFSDDFLIKEGCLGFSVEVCEGFDEWLHIFLFVSLDYYVKNENIVYSQISEGSVELDCSIQPYDKDSKLLFDLSYLPNNCNGSINGRQVEIIDTYGMSKMNELYLTDCTISNDNILIDKLESMVNLEQNKFDIGTLKQEVYFDNCNKEINLSQLKSKFLNLMIIDSKYDIELNIKNKMFIVNIAWVDDREQYKDMILDSLFSFLDYLIDVKYSPNDIDFILEASLNNNEVLNYQSCEYSLLEFMDRAKTLFKSAELKEVGVMF